MTAVTSDNGYAAHKVTWTDSAGLTRTAVMVDETSTTPYTGYLRQYTYQASGVTRVCTGSYNYAKDGHLEFSGDGFVQNHTVDGGDVSTGNSPPMFPGTTTITLQGSSHAIITYSIPNYSISGTKVPTTIQWFFADGRSHPIFAISQDASASTGNLGADSRSPYGDMAYDGSTSGDPITGNIVGGFSYGDTYKFVTLASGPEQVTRASPWKATEANTIPYAMQWVDPASVDAEMGHVATVPISVNDQGIDTQTSQYDDPPDLFDPRTQSGTSLPADNTEAFQIINEPDTLPTTGTTNSKRLTWGANFGRVGGFDAYGEYTDTKDYSQHSTMPFDEPLQGKRASGALMAYSVFVVFGPHLGSYETGTVGQTVTQMENAAKSTLTASTGTATTTGPAGVGNASKTTITYSPAGYDPTYSTWEVNAAGNAVNATLTPPNGQTLDHPVFVVNNYTAAQLPNSISVGPGLNTAGTDYFATLDTAGQRLWITVNRVASSAVNLVVANTQSAQTIGAFSVIPTQTYGVAPFTVTPPTATSGLPVTLSVLTPATATISGDTLTIIGVGTVTLAANQAGNSSYTAAPQVTTSFLVNQGTQTITFPPLGNLTYGAAPFSTGASASSGLPLSYTTTGPVTISGNTVTVTGAGGVGIRAHQNGNTDYAAAPSIYRSFTVAKAAQTITFSPVSTKTYAPNGQFHVAAVASSGLAVTYRVISGPVTLNNNLVTITGAGSVELGADQAGNANYNAATEATTSFTIKPATQTITFPAISNQVLGAGPITLTATASSGLPVTYRNTGPARISGNTLTITGVGTVSVGAYQTGNSDYLSAPEARQSFTVTAAP